ncbi:MAG: hypothetical protein JJ900_16530 [Rhodospirillales bacterium]|nr:hypothetical protein [Rhodospirillales bacterium]MBO6788457.1 hypothetical protein [Rhodospirillales bacterium]
MLNPFKKLFQKLEEASQRAETKCNACGHVMQGPRSECEKCKMPISPAKD